MVLYKCENCNFSTTHKTKFLRHQNRKYSCLENNSRTENAFNENENVNNEKMTQNDSKMTQNDSILVSNFNEKRSNFSTIFQKKEENSKDDNLQKIQERNESCICEWCGKKFRRYYNKDRHYNICKKKKVSDNLEMLDSKYNELKMELENLKKSGISNGSNVGNNSCNTTNTNTTNTNTTNTNTTNTNTTNIININNFGKENVDYITSDMVKRLLKGNLSKVIPQLIKNVYCNPKHIENMNVYVQNKKEPFIMIKNGDGWILESKKDVMYTLRENGRYLFDDRTHGMEMTNKEQKYSDKVLYYNDDEIDMEPVNIGLINNKQHLQKLNFV